MFECCMCDGLFPLADTTLIEAGNGQYDVVICVPCYNDYVTV